MGRILFPTQGSFQRGVNAQIYDSVGIRDRATDSRVAALLVFDQITDPVSIRIPISAVVPRSVKGIESVLDFPVVRQSVSGNGSETGQSRLLIETYTIAGTDTNGA